MRSVGRIVVLGIVIGCVLTVFDARPASAQFGKLKDKVKKKVEDKAEKETDKAIDDAVDEGFDQAGDVVTGSGDSDGESGAESKSGSSGSSTGADESSSRSASAESDGDAIAEGGTTAAMRPGEGAWANYDFVPGDQVIYMEDFSTTPVGDFPRRIEFIEGNMEVVEWQGAHWLRINEDAKFEVPLPANLPDKFTVEADIYMPPAFTLYMLEGSTAPKRRWAETYTVRLRTGNYQELRGGVGVGSGKWLTSEDFGKTTGIVDFRAMFSGSYLKAYVNETRTANIPNADFARADRIQFMIDKHGSRGDEGVLIGHIRVAEGGKKFLYDELEANGRVATQGIYFDINSDRIRPESTPTLKEMGKMLTDHPELRLMIEGHTDSQGDEAYNLELSQKRAAAVKNYLCNEYGIAPDRLETSGLGEGQPVDSNDTPEGRQNNRRVELVKLN
ncbi:MAG: hypothetical protein Kow0074_17190 [Candidatus Zixiibacteriota bacterium]